MKIELHLTLDDLSFEHCHDDAGMTVAKETAAEVAELQEPDGQVAADVEGPESQIEVAKADLMPRVVYDGPTIIIGCRIPVSHRDRLLEIRAKALRNNPRSTLDQSKILRAMLTYVIYLVEQGVVDMSNVQTEEDIVDALMALN